MLALCADMARHALEQSPNRAAGATRPSRDVLVERAPTADAHPVVLVPLADVEPPPPDPGLHRAHPQGSGGYHVVAE